MGSVSYFKIDAAINTVSTERARLGAKQNRLEHTIKNLDTAAENLQASESRIRDVDMAQEMMNFTKNISSIRLLRQCWLRLTCSAGCSSVIGLICYYYSMNNMDNCKDAVKFKEG